MASFRNIYTSLMLVIAGSTSKDLARQVSYLKAENQRTTDFVKRIFTCFCRIRDKYDKPLVCLAVLGSVPK